MEKIKDLNAYNNGMKKGMEDKIWFIDYIPKDATLIDFGCADGTLLNEVSRFCPKMKLYGIDNNAEMLKEAMKNTPNAEGFFLSQDPCFFRQGCRILNLSSVIHEVYSYAETEEKIDDFWNNIVLADYDYIIIRDMVKPHPDLEITVRDAEMLREWANKDSDFRYNQLFDFSIWWSEATSTLIQIYIIFY